MNVPNQPMAPAPPPKKGLGPLAWIGIGCGTIFVLGMIALAAGGWWAKRQVDKYADNPALAAAELLVRANPEVEVVEVDREAGTLKIRNKKTGEEITMNAEDAKEGKFTFETKEGKATFETSGTEDGGTVKVTGDDGQVATFQAGGGAPQNLPSWLPIYPGGMAQGSFDSTSEQERTAAFAVSTQDPADKVLAFYEEKLKAAGLKVEKSTFESGGKSGGVLNGTSENPQRQVGISVAAGDDGKTQASISFSEKTN
jgi:hypothetical protein